MRGYTYILNENHIPIPCDDQMEWGAWMKLPFEATRRVAQTTVDKYWISTVFLGLDHGTAWITGVDGPPVLFETMVQCNGQWTDEQHRYSTWELALEGHRGMVAKYGGDTASVTTEEAIHPALAQRRKFIMD